MDIYIVCWFINVLNVNLYSKVRNIGTYLYPAD